jgi:nitrite reductase/ring-hydroxylating ferredoxin subunit
VSVDGREAIDVRVDSPAREGLTGTAPATIYRPVRDEEQVTLAPDGRPMDQQPAWRNDFPIDWPQDQYVERRDFVKFMVLTSLAFTVGQFWIAGQNWWRRRRGEPPIARIGSVDDLAIGGAAAFTYPAAQDPCVLVRTAAAGFVAYSQKCTHLSCAVIPRPADDVIACPCHEGVFDLQSGRPIAGPPRRPLARVRVEVRGRDVYAVGIEPRTT